MNIVEQYNRMIENQKNYIKKQTDIIPLLGGIWTQYQWECWNL